MSNEFYLMSRIKSEAEIILSNVGHASRRSNLDDALQRMRKLVDELFPASDPKVDQMTLTEVRQLELQLHRLIYKCMVRKEQLAKEPPTLGVHVVEGAQAEDKVK